MIFSDLSLRAVITGVLAAIVGFAGAFAVVVQGLGAVGANAEQTASALMALCIGMGVCSIVLSLFYRMPISIAWSTPGAAMLTTAGVGAADFNLAVGAFCICAVLLTLAGLWKPLTRLIGQIPTPVASAMLAGILFELCLAPVKAVSEYPLFALPLFLVWLVVGKLNKLLAVPAALIAFFVIIFFFLDISQGMAELQQQSVFTKLVWVTPAFSVTAFIGIAIPLFVVTMASQNIPGIGVLHANKYTPDSGKLFTVTGAFSLLTAPFGGHAINLAAIIAALCASEEAHSDRSKRYWSAVMAGVCYLLIAVFVGFVTRLVTLAPPILIQTVAGLALIGTCAGAVVAAFDKPKFREAAAVTFFITASGVAFLGISGAFWGLVAGWMIILWQNVDTECGPDTQA